MDREGIGDAGGAQGDVDGDSPEVREPRKVAIIGTAPGWEQAPFNDPSWEIWGLGSGFTRLPRWDVWFELHRLEDVCKTWAPGNEAQEAASRAAYIEWMRDQTQPIVLREARAEIPNGQAFPLHEVLSVTRYSYWTNTVSWLTGLAIAQGVDAIGIWGVDMELDSEYGTQRPSCEYLLGIAEGRGIEIHIPDTSSLLKARKLYGFQDDDGFILKHMEKRDRMAKAKQETEAQIQQFQHRLAHLNGALEVVQYDMKNWR